MSRKSLVKKEILEKFGKENSIDLPYFLKEISKISQAIGDFQENKPFFQGNKINFSISKKPLSSQKMYDNFKNFLSGCINWKSNRTQFNITPPSPYTTIAANSITSLLNPNAIWDVAEGKLGNLEVYLSKYLASLANWNNNPSGIFTFGGTGTNMYGIKIGINKSIGNFAEKGIDENVYVISNDEGHSCHVTLCNWLGLPKKNCLRIKTNKKGIINHKMLLKKVEELIKNGKKIGCIILNGGTNFNLAIDPIRKISKGLIILKKKYSLDYLPHLHVDSVIGWVFLLFKDYDFNKNSLHFPKEIVNRLKKIYSKIKQIEFADSFGVDFHKTCFCPYSTSTFMLKNAEDWRLISAEGNVFIHQDFNRGDYKPGQYSLETSRPATGIVSAYVTLNSLGIDGIRSILANYLYVSNDLRKRILKSKKLSSLNADSDGWATFFIVNKDRKTSFDKLYLNKYNEELSKNNLLQKEFYSFLEKKYNFQLPWFIGFNKCYKKNLYDQPISCLKWYPMSPYMNILSNKEFIRWIEGNYEEFKNKKN